MLGDLKLEHTYHRKQVTAGCLRWLAQLKDENGFEELVKATKLSKYYCGTSDSPFISILVATTMPLNWLVRTMNTTPGMSRS